jgi:hypothetical protein
MNNTGLATKFLKKPGQILIYFISVIYTGYAHFFMIQKNQVYSHLFYLPDGI